MCLEHPCLMILMCLDYLRGNPETSSNKNMAGNRAISENLLLCGFNGVFITDFLAARNR